MDIKKKFILVVVLFLALVLLVGFIMIDKNRDLRDAGPVVGADVGWLEVDLTDVRTGEIFRLSDFRGKPVLLESFAVWCPTCLKQQKEIQKLETSKGDEIIHVALDTDPNEDIGKVLKHINDNNFNWYYAIPPIEMTRELTKVFGLSFVNAPSAPVVLICSDQSHRFLKKGVKKYDKLLAEIERGCSV